MAEPTLILTIPTGTVTATSLGVAGLATHRSPGSGKHFSGRCILVELAADGDKPAFTYLDEGGWRNAHDDTVAALAGVRGGSRTKTALSSGAFSCTPLAAYRGCYLAKTSGAVLPLDPAVPLVSYPGHLCDERMTADQVAAAIGRPAPAERRPRLYMVISPIQFLMLSNLTPEEYGWYATHRPGKMFRQVMFAELTEEQPSLAAQSRFSDARRELEQHPDKKTKTIVFEDCLSRIQFRTWCGYRRAEEGGLYVGDKNGLTRYPFPALLPHGWEKLEG